MATPIPYGWFGRLWRCWKMSLLRRNPSQEAIGISALFSQNLTTNPIDLYYVMWFFSNAWIEGVFIEYKMNPNPIDGLLELLVQLREWKLLFFSGFALLSILSHECARVQMRCRMLNLLLKLKSDGFACIFT
jgi:hypothetical protein